ncbi:hypothetical protein SAMN05519103_08492 [Rhizobiales bacterium GAS113]|nr:hypothetical protein SAMN05519103_08492 [Rhizobiales bacterium GAS113]
MSEHVSLTDSSASEDADRETAAALARAYLEAAGGDAERACHVLAFRTLRLVRSSSAGFVRGTMEAAFRSDCEALARETARLAEAFAPLEDIG